MASPPPIIEPDTILPDGAGEPTYRVIEHVANGGMAGIYHVAIEGRRDGPFAMKVNHRRSGVPGFFREAWWQSQNRPGMVTCYWTDHTVIDGVPTAIYIMPYLQEGSLVAYLQKRMYSLQEAVAWIHSISETLDAVGCIHRDLKPENILMLGRQPVVSDFGIALPADKAARSAWGEVPARVIGTPHYMSPEQHLVRLLGELDVRSDIYALTLMLHELWFGSLPYPTDITCAKLMEIKTDGLVKPIASTKIPAADELLLKGLRHKRVDRYQTHAEFRQALLRVHGDLLSQPQTTRTM